jgi:hypothetical protein
MLQVYLRLFWTRLISSTMMIGLDFDNTIVCYEQALALLVDDCFDLPNEIPRTKLGLRDYLRAEDREPEWTAFQGELYGPGMRYAKPFGGAISTMQQLIGEGFDLVIVSHRSRYPYAGPQYDLHDAAHNWISDHLHPNGLFDGQSKNIYFLETLSEKLKKISELSCDIFLDDLTAVLDSPEFPESTLGILFDPANINTMNPRIYRIGDWPSIFSLLNKLP